MILFTQRSLITALLTFGLAIGMGLTAPLSALGEEGSEAKPGSDHKAEHREHDKGKPDRQAGEGSDRKPDRADRERSGSKKGRGDKEKAKHDREHGAHEKEAAGSGRKDAEKAKRGDKRDKEGESEEAALDRKASYAFGLMFGSQLRGADFALDEKQFMKAFRTALAGEEPAMSQQEAMQVLRAWQERQMAKAQEKAAAEAGKQTETNEAFLEENAARKGVTTTESGLQYKVLREGGEDARNVTENSTVTVHYKGELLDGTVFDQTDQGRPVPIDLSEQRLIEGWLEALPMMRKGDKWRLFIPPSLGYGNRPAGEIPPGSLLIFDLEVVDVAEGDAEEASGRRGRSEEPRDDAEEDREEAAEEDYEDED